MSELTPTEAAFLAENIYDVQNEKAFKKLLNNGIFSQKKGHQQKLNADIGGRIIRKARDGFGLCAMGGGFKPSVWSNEGCIVLKMSVNIFTLSTADRKAGHLSTGIH